MRIIRNLSPSRRKATPMCPSLSGALTGPTIFRRVLLAVVTPTRNAWKLSLQPAVPSRLRWMMETGSNPIFSTAPTRDYSSTQVSGERWRISQPVRSVWSWLRNCTKKLIISMITTSFSNTQDILFEKLLKYARHHV